jgi:hypothetical protein
LALSVAASSAGLHLTRRTEAMHLAGRAAMWPKTHVFGATIALLALHVLVLAPLLISLR